MKKFVMIVAMAAALLVVDSQLASAGRRGGRGGCGGGGCGGGYAGGCGMGGCGSYGGCGIGGCGMGGFGGYAGCQTCGGSVMGAGSYAAAPCTTCSGGVCTISPIGGTAVAQADVNQATLVVNLPEDATLTVDNEPTSSTSGNRVFVTPTLETGKEYEYTLKAQVVRDGQVRTATAQVTVRPGEVSSVELQIPATGVAAQ